MKGAICNSSYPNFGLDLRVYDFSALDFGPQHECSPVNLQHILTTPFSKNAYKGLLLSLRDEEVKGMKVDILVGFQSR